MNKLAFIVLIFISAAPHIRQNTIQRQTDQQNKFIEGKSFFSPFGKRRKIVLPDHTEVVLNSNTTVWLDKNFGTINRQVRISGDAFFSIKKAGKPFIVYTPHLILSTPLAMMKVNGYAGQAGEETLVFSGNVRAVKSYYSKLDHDPYLLKNGEMVMMNKDIDLMEKETFDTDEWKPWMQDRMVLTKVSPNELVKRLENWFNVDVAVYGAPPANLVYNGTFVGSDLQNILTTIGKQWKFTPTARGNQVILQF